MNTMNLSSRTILIPSIVLLIGSVIGTNAFADDPFKNKVNIDTDTKQKNDCEGEASATNSAVCKALVDRDIGEINISP